MHFWPHEQTPLYLMSLCMGWRLWEVQHCSRGSSTVFLRKGWAARWEGHRCWAERKRLHGWVRNTNTPFIHTGRSLFFSLRQHSEVWHCVCYLYVQGCGRPRVQARSSLAKRWYGGTGPDKAHTHSLVKKIKKIVWHWIGKVDSDWIYKWGFGRIPN